MKRLVTRQEVEDFVQLSSTTIYRLMQVDLNPPPIKYRNHRGALASGGHPRMAAFTADD